MNALKHILIVEDLYNDRLLLTTLLTGNGYHVSTAANGKEALEKLASNNIDLIISDILMPGMDGYRFCLAVKSNKKLHTIPFVFYSATFTDNDDEALAQEVGADLFIHKPTEPDEFIRLIQNVVTSVARKDFETAKADAEIGEDRIAEQYDQSLAAKLAVRAVDLQISEIKYRTLFETSSAAIMLFDGKTFIDCNTACRKLFGCDSQAQFIGTIPSDWSPDKQPDGQESYSLSQQHIDTAFNNKTHTFEWLHQRRDGSTFPAEVELSTMNLEGTLMVQATVHDISLRKQAERRSNLRKKVLEQLVNKIPLTTILSCIAKDLENEFTDVLCSIMMIDENDHHLTMGAAPNMPDVYKNAVADIKIDPSVCTRGVAMCTGKRSVIDHVCTNPLCNNYHELAQKIGISSCWSEPIKSSEEKVIGVITLHGKQPITPNDNDIILISYFSNLTALAIERYYAEKQLNLANTIYQNSSEGMLITDKNNTILAINPAFTVMTGYSIDEVKGKNPKILSSGKSDDYFYQKMWKQINETGHWQGEIWNKRKNGDLYAEWLTINSTYDDNGEVDQRVAIFSDITEKKALDAQLLEQANYDSLTNLPNRNSFRQHLEEEIVKYQRTQMPIALLFIDLDRFKEVNDSLGHEKGDILLIEAGRRIQECVRDVDLVARLGGDEFTIMLTDLAQRLSAERIASNIIQALSMPFQLGEDKVFISASVGITFYPDDANNMTDLLKNADQAMYFAKDSGRGRFSYFTKSMQDIATHRIALTNDLRTALAANQFQLYYQPIVNLSTGNIFKAEALIRWHHPQRGIISPAEFIPLAEDSGLIIPIGDWVFKQAVQQVKTWRETIDDNFQISINKSPVQFRSEDQHSEWMAFIDESGITGHNIAVEITESLLLDNNPKIAQQLLQYRDADIQVAVDDFGTGYSALSYLKKFDIDYLKIDQSFTRNLAHDSQDLALCEAIIVMAHKLGIKVIAEGIETEEQRQLLINIDCNYGQGYLFSKPLPAIEMDQLLKQSMR